MEGFWQEAYNPDNFNTPEKNINIEQKETGKNVLMRLFLIRHAQREVNDICRTAPITANGWQECIKLANEIGKSPVIGGECSNSDRTNQTAKGISFGHFRATDIRIPKFSEELSSHSSEKFRNEIRAYVKKKLLEENPALTKEELSKIDLLSTIYGIDFYLNYKEKFDDETYPPAKTAANVALRINEIINGTAKMESGKAMDYLFATHDYVIAAFLQQVLIWERDGKTKTGFNSLNELGVTSIEFLEHLEITAKTDSKGKLIIRTGKKGERILDAKFRGKKCGIDINRFDKLVAIGNQLKEAKEINRAIEIK